MEKWFTIDVFVNKICRPEDKGKVVKEVKQADSIVLTISFDRRETLDRLSEYWLPLFRQLEVNRLNRSILRVEKCRVYAHSPEVL